MTHCPREALYARLDGALASEPELTPDEVMYAREALREALCPCCEACADLQAMRRMG